MKYNQEKIELFRKYTLEDYKQNLIVEEITTFISTEKTDNSFVQIGINCEIEDDLFMDPSVHEYLPGLGRAISIGEEDFLIQNILENKEIERIDFKEDFKEFPKHVWPYNSIIIISTKFFVEFFTKLMYKIDYEYKYPRLEYRSRIISIPERILGNKIIILDKKAITYQKQIFKDNESLDIQIKPSKEMFKVDITIRSVNKIKQLNPSLIKILEVKDETKTN